MFKTANFQIPLTKENVLKRTTEYDIFRYYVGYDFELAKMYRSPFRDDDDTASFNIYLNKDRSLKFKDFGLAAGSCFDFVMVKYNLSFYHALEKINSDLQLGLQSSNIPIVPKVQTSQGFISLEKKEAVIQFEPQPFTASDLKYWEQYGISKQTLKYYNVFSCNKVYLNKQLKFVYSEISPSFAYFFKGPQKVKIYRPYADKQKREIKFISNADGNLLQGLEQLTYTDTKQPFLIITKSLKDVMLLHELGFPAVAPNGESMFIPQHLIDHLHTHFEKLIVIYDNDNAGLKGSSKLAATLEAPFHYGYSEEKDLSDHYKRFGKESTLLLINKLLTMKHIVAVYGSLREGAYNYNSFKRSYGEEIQKLGTTTVNGYDLYSLGAYPGINVSEDPNKPLVVDLLEVTDRVYASINRMELGANYSVRIIDVALHTGEPMKATIYLYNGNLKGRSTMVEDGNWLNYISAKQASYEN